VAGWYCPGALSAVAFVRMAVLTLAVASLLIVFNGCQVMKKNAPETVPYVDLERYSGLWYEVASYPARFQEGCHCTTAEYTLSSDGSYVSVTNRCRRGSPSGSKSGISGKAFVVKGSGNARLRVQFFWPFRAPYWVVGLAEDYSWALVSGPSRKYLWILSRSPQMEEETYNTILGLLHSKGFDTDKLRLCDQSCGEQ
jgi:apolipoprotein D and lipocalin family protein